MPTNLTPQANDPVVTLGDGSDPVVDPKAPVTDPNAVPVVDPNAPVVDPDPKTPDPTKGTDGETGAPETYADFTFPEGTEADAKGMEAFLPMAKELDLTQEQAQGLVTLQTDLLARQAEVMQEAWDTTNTEWVEAARNDPEIGGTDHDAKMATAMKAIKQFGTKELLEAFDATGVGNHPEMIRFAYRIGKIMEDEKVFFGNSHAQANKTAAQILFPDQN